MLLLASFSFSRGRIYKSSSFCQLVIHHCFIIEKELRLSSETEVVMLRSSLSTLNVLASTLLIACETDKVAAFMNFQRTMNLPSPGIYKLGLSLQVRKYCLTSLLI